MNEICSWYSMSVSIFISMFVVFLLLFFCWKCTIAVSKRQLCYNPHHGNKLKNAKTVKLLNILITARLQVVTETKKNSIETQTQHQLDKNIATYHGGKGRADTDIEFFPGSNMLVHWV